MLAQLLPSWDDFLPSNEIECRGLFQVPPLVSPTSLAPLASHIFSALCPSQYPSQVFAFPKLCYRLQVLPARPEPKSTFATTMRTSKFGLAAMAMSLPS